jgi:tetratricopeptide (TPR) repeat protein
MKKFPLGRVAILFIVLTVVFAFSILFFPTWRESPASYVVLVGFILTSVISALADLRTWLAQSEAPPPPPANPISQNQPKGIQIAGASIDSENIGRDKYSGDRIEGDQFDGDKVARDKITNIILPPPALSPLHQLRPPPPDFTGRDTELTELRQKFHQGVVITGMKMHGMGGVGKTALALKLANEVKSQYPDAQFDIDLQGAGPTPLSPAEIMSRIINAFLPNAHLSENIADLQDSYLSCLDGKRALLFFDNAKDEVQVKPLIPPQGCLLIVTSREKLLIRECHSLSIDSMPQDDAYELLRKIAPRLNMENAKKIANLCGCLPFALCAAGGQLAVYEDLDPAEYIKQLQNEKIRLQLADITSDGNSITFEASFNLSYATLNPETARVFRTLSIFPADFDAPAAEVVCEDVGHSHLSQLVLPSLVQFDSSKKRYRLHDLAKVFANSRLTEKERYVTQKRYASHYARVLRASRELYEQGGNSILQGLALFDLERVNIETGQTWAVANMQDTEDAVQLCSDYPDAGVYILTLRQHPREKIHWLEAAITAAQKLKNRRAEGSNLGNLGNAYAAMGETRKAIEYYEQRLVIAHEIGDRRGEGNALGNLGLAYANLGETRKAIEYYEQRLVIAHEIGDRHGESNALGNLGNAYANLNETRKAIKFHEQALVIDRETGDRRGEGLDLDSLGVTYARLGETRKAIEYYKQSLVIAREVVNRRGEGNVLWNMSLAFNKLSEHQNAVDHAEASLKIREEIEDPRAEKVRKQLVEWRKTKP